MSFDTLLFLRKKLDRNCLWHIWIAIKKNLVGSKNIGGHFPCLFHGLNVKRSVPKLNRYVVAFYDFDNCHHFSILLKTGFIISKNQMATNFFPGNWICLPLINLTYFASNVPLEQFKNSFHTFQADWQLKKTPIFIKGDFNHKCRVIF